MFEFNWFVLLRAKAWRVAAAPLLSAFWFVRMTVLERHRLNMSSGLIYV